MVKRYLKYSIVIILFLVTSNLFAQGVFSTVASNKSEVYVGEPVAITVSVYTPTWFTQGVDIGNLTVNGAFTVYFRSVSTSRKINGQNYAGIQFIYNVFPFEEQDIVIPALNFEVESPKVGGYKGIRRKVQSKEKVIKIKPIPPDIDRNQWFVTGGMTVRENWTGNRNAVKVGDVLERTITRNTRNTLAELIPPIIWDSIPSVSSYPIRPNVNTNKTRTDISAIRTDGVKYLFEEEGDIILPDMEFSWWNPYQKKYLKRTIKGRTISVKPNPDLGILRTIKDSLNVKQALINTEEDEMEAKTYFGLSQKQLLVLLVVLGVVLAILIRFLLKARKAFIRERKEYRTSETYAFRRFLSAVSSKKSHLILPSLYRWISHLQLGEPTLKAFAAKAQFAPLNTEIDQLEKQLNDQPGKSIDLDKTIWRKARKSFLNAKKKPQKVNSWINP